MCLLILTITSFIDILKSKYTFELLVMLLHVLLLENINLYYW